LHRSGEVGDGRTKGAMRRTTNEILMRQYLLGDTPQEEKDSLEGQYFADAVLFEELVAAEHDLIDSYVRGELKESDRQRFELRYGKSPQQRERVDFARALNQSSRQTVLAEKTFPWKTVWAFLSGERQIPRWAFAVAALVVVAGGSWLMVQNQRLRGELHQALAGKAELSRQQDALRQQIASLDGNPKTPAQENQESLEIAKLEAPVPEVTLRLTSGMARGLGGRQNTLLLPPAESWGVRLQLVLDRNEYASYQAVIRTAEGNEIRRVSGLKSQRADNEWVVVFRVPSKLIGPGDYMVALNGSSDGRTEEAEAYSFRVVRR
jgi:anti-sigma factor RsiW